MPRRSRRMASITSSGRSLMCRPGVAAPKISEPTPRTARRRCASVSGYPHSKTLISSRFACRPQHRRSRVLNGKRIVVVMPAFHAGRTLEATWRELPRDIIDGIIVVDDASDDDTVVVARRLGLEVILHPRNMGYGANQKTCYREALSRGADIVVMVHPDYQYDPRLVTAMAAMIASGVYDVVIGSPPPCGGARAGGEARRGGAG